MILKKFWGKIKAKYHHFQLKLSPESGWVSVYESTDLFAAKIRKMRLEDEGIHVQLFNQIDSSYNNFGFVKLEVPREFEEKAKQI
ncbi:MAG: DUF2007 domain-containing protein [Bacteroidetes bacterium]|nr:DUF2007 domain-containing protein [Bacteroidota bacterium]